MGRVSSKLQRIINEQDFCFTPGEMRTVESAIRLLADYEDTGLKPNEINELRSDIEKLLKFPRFVEAMTRSGDKELEGLKNEPLTIEELQGLYLFDWVWIECLTECDRPDKGSAYYRKHFALSDVDETELWCGYPGLTFAFKYCEYGKTWLAYRHEPEEGQKGEATGKEHRQV